MDKKSNTFAHLLAVITVSVWGTTFISTKLLLLDFEPIEILFIRFLIGFLILLILKPGILKVNDKKQELYFIFAGITGVTLYFLFENIALTHSPASNIGVLVSIAPFFTALLSHFFVEKSKISFRFFIGFGTAIIGIGIISFRSSAGIELNPLGDFLAILAAVIWAIYSLIMKKISSFEYNTIQVTRKTFFYGIIFMLPFLYFMDFSVSWSNFQDMTNNANLIFLGVGASAICFLSWNHAIIRLGAMRASAYIYLVPVVTIFTSALILGEKITLPIILGSAFILIGLYLSEQKNKT